MPITKVKTVKTIKDNEIQLFSTESLQSFDKTLLYIGVVHGDEQEGEFLVYKLMDEIQKDFSLVNNNRVLFIPVLNPDGKDLIIRGNSNGVDINRNFPTQNWEKSENIDKYYSGPAPASEIETRFVIDILELYRPDLIITLHTPYRVVNFDGPAQDIAQLMSDLNNYPVQQDIGYSTPGSFGTYAGIERNIPTITLELPEDIDQNILWEENKEALIQILKHKTKRG